MISLTAGLFQLGVIWNAVAPGVWKYESKMAPEGPLGVVRAIAIRIDPATHRFRLDLVRRDYGLRPAWTIDSMPVNAVVALNAGQFTGGFPWGWVVRDGVESQPPGTGTLGMAFVIDSSGSVALLMPDEIQRTRAGAMLAFQSYPALLVDGELPWELRAAGRGVNLDHRDSRLAICTLPAGGLVIALTRVTAFGKAGATLPWGPTVPEMAAHMRTLGCRRAMLLDGGISSQLALRGSNGRLTQWTNWRMVPMGLVITSRSQYAARRAYD